MARRVLIVRGGALPRASGLGRAHHDLVDRVEQGLVDGFVSGDVLEHDLDGGLFHRWRRRRHLHPRAVLEKARAERQKFATSILHITDQEQAHLVPRESPLPTSVTVHDLFHLEPRRLQMPEGRITIGHRNPGFMRSQDLSHIRQGLARADLLICISEATAAEARTLWPDKPVAVVPHGIDVDGYDPVARPLPRPEGFGKDVDFLFVGSEVPRKRLGFLIEVLGALPASVRSACVLHKVGAESDPEVRSRIEAAAAAHDVSMVWHGALSDLDLCAMYQHAEALLFPSAAEGFGLPPLEAMASGCPVRTADLPAHNEVAPEAWCIDATDRAAWGAELAGIVNRALGRPKDAAGRRRPRAPDEAALARAREFDVSVWAERIADAWCNHTS